MKSTDKIIDYLKKTYQPESIIVYGSFADGSANLNSDFDALIIAGKEKLHDSSFVDGVFLMYLFIRLLKFRLNKIAARWPAKAVAQFYFY